MTSNTLTALLYEHEDGRYAVNPDTTGDPGWHRLGPVDVSALTAQAGAPAAPAALICAAHAVVDADDAQALTQKHIEVLRAAAIAAERATAAAVAPMSAALEQIAKGWDGCMYEDLGGDIDIGAGIRAEAARLMAAQPAAVENYAEVNDADR